jgi:hypothetical protein
MKTTAWLAGAALLMGFSMDAPAPKTVVKGTLVTIARTNQKTSVELLLLEVRLKVGKTTIAASAVQPGGHFVISNESNAVANLVYAGLGVNGEVYLATVLPHRADTLRVIFGLPVSTAKPKGRVACPKCRLRDKVLPIGGQAGVVTVRINAKGDTTHLPFDRKYYHPESDVSSWLDPHWYCIRDTIKF